MRKHTACVMVLFAAGLFVEAQEPEIQGRLPANKINKLTEAEKKEGFNLLFNGKDLEGWKAAENPKSFSVQEGELVVKGPRGHLFYEGEINGAKFKNFHFKAQVMTKKGANSGIFFHTKFQAGGWPRQGYEAQVNQTHKDWRKTGSVYASKDVGEKDNKAEDYKWFQYDVIVKGKTVTIKIDGELVNEYTEKDDHKHPTKRLGEGTVAIQAHDPGSSIHYRNIMIRVLE